MPGRGPPPAAAGSGHPGGRGSAAASCLTLTMINSCGVTILSGLTLPPARIAGADQAVVAHDAEHTCHVSTEAIPGMRSGI